MPPRETRGFLERRRARRAPVAAGPERGDARSRARRCRALALCLLNDFPTSCQPHRSRYNAIRTHSYITMVESSTTRSHTKIHSAVFFFGFVDSRDFCSFRSAGEKRSEKKELSGNSHHSSRHFSERSARHPPAHTMQIFVKTRTSSPSLSIENPVSPPLRLHRGAAAARASVDRSETDCCIFDRASIASPRIRASRRPRATARHPR